MIYKMTLQKYNILSGTAYLPKLSSVDLGWNFIQQN